MLFILNDNRKQACLNERHFCLYFLNKETKLLNCHIIIYKGSLIKCSCFDN